jgi:hypothetical protein
LINVLGNQLCSSHGYRLSVIGIIPSVYITYCVWPFQLRPPRTERLAFPNESALSLHLSTVIRHSFCGRASVLSTAVSLSFLSTSFEAHNSQHDLRTSLFPHPYLGKSPSNSNCRRISELIMNGSCAAGAINTDAFMKPIFSSSNAFCQPTTFPRKRGPYRSPELIEVPLIPKKCQTGDSIKQVPEG